MLTIQSSRSRRPAAATIAGTLLGRSSALAPRHATLGRIHGDGPRAAAVDEVITTFFPAPHSYTGQALVEISAHGNPVVLDAIVGAAVAAGARLAEPGEFTLRAFLNGKRDLVQAEAVADLIDAATPLQARTAFDQLDGTLTGRIATIDAGLFDLIARLEAALDFPDEGYRFIGPGAAADAAREVIRELDGLLADGTRGRAMREGAQVVIAGRPNAGKSSLFNRLHGSDRAIVTEVAGTTRDLVTGRIDLDGLVVDLVDTAGWRAPADAVEREGVARGAQARATADLTLVVLDASAECVSAKTGAGIRELRMAIVEALTSRESLRDPPAVSNARHLELMRRARAAMATACDALDAGGTSEEFVLVDLQAARACFDEIVGRRTSEDVLRHIFERFCIGEIAAKRNRGTCSM